MVIVKLNLTRKYDKDLETLFQNGFYRPVQRDHPNWKFLPASLRGGVRCWICRSVLDNWGRACTDCRGTYFEFIRAVYIGTVRDMKYPPGHGLKDTFPINSIIPIMAEWIRVYLPRVDRAITLLKGRNFVMEPTGVWLEGDTVDPFWELPNGKFLFESEGRGDSHSYASASPTIAAITGAKRETGGTKAESKTIDNSPPVNQGAEVQTIDSSPLISFGENQPRRQENDSSLNPNDMGTDALRQGNIDTPVLGKSKDTHTWSGGIKTIPPRLYAWGLLTKGGGNKYLPPPKQEAPPSLNRARFLKWFLGPMCIA